MNAWIVERQQRVAQGAPLKWIDAPAPEPGPHQVRLRVAACGVCRTDLHIAEGDLPLHRPRVIPGHEIVGYVDAVGSEAARFGVGDRIGIAWLRRTCGTCRYCRCRRENLCRSPRFTGWDDDGGYAEYAVVDEDFAYRLPDGIDDVHAAPLLCAGIIGYRALRLANLPRDGALGIWGFGASAHITAQIALRRGARVHVITRAAAARELALALGVDSVGAIGACPPEELDSAVFFAPAGELIPDALRALAPGGTLAVAGIHLSRIPPLDYDLDLFEERTLRSVTANTREDGVELLALAAELRLDVSVQPYPLDRGLDALRDLAGDKVTGAAVLTT